MRTASLPWGRASVVLSMATLAACPGPTVSGQGGDAGHGAATSTGGFGASGCPDVPTQIFAKKCGTAGCHGPESPAQGLDLVSPGFADAILDEPGVVCSGLLANTKFPDLSSIYEKLLPSPSCGARMPLGKDPLSDGEIACVKSWIAAQGAGGAGGAVTGTGGFGGFGGGEGGMGTCNDGILNGVETDVDCGGSCPLCAVGKGCAGPTDCESFACASHLCVDATCADGALNGSETDLDCGGPNCAPCPGGDHCLLGTDCASGTCQPSLLCASSCTDGWKDGLEKGVDCGGLCPVGCPPGTACDVATDCASGICASGACATPSCTDMVANGGEGDVDCGGPCAPCLLGQHCNVTADCAAGACVGGTCESVLYVSEVRSHGKNGNGYADELVELYNPGSLPVTLDATWVLMIRNANGGCQDMGYGIPLYVGAGQVIPPHGHALFTGSGYAQSPASDGTLLNSGGYGGVHDAGSITLLHQGKLVDTVCYYTSQATLDALQVCASPYACAGTPIDNAQAVGGVDVSFSRKPGGVLGNGQMTGDNAADFAVVMPANPQNLASPPAP